MIHFDDCFLKYMSDERAIRIAAAIVAKRAQFGTAELPTKKFANPPRPELQQVGVVLFVDIIDDVDEVELLTVDPTIDELVVLL